MPSSGSSEGLAARMGGLGGEHLGTTAHQEERRAAKAGYNKRFRAVQKVGVMAGGRASQKRGEGEG